VRVAYLVNQYPMVSLTFIRREIRALEARGVHVDRFAIRRWSESVVDADDHEELARTRCILSVGASGMLASVLITMMTRPARFAAMAMLLLRLTRKSDRGVLLHLVYLAEACVLLRWLLAGGAQHLHAHFGSNPAEVAMYCNGLGGPPFSFTVHGPEEIDRAVGLGYAEKIERAAFVVAISDFCRSQLFRWCNHSDWNKIVIVYCGLDRALLAAPVTPVPGNRQFVCVGRLCAEKGQLLLLESAAKLKSKGLAFKLLLVGDGPIRPELETMIQDLGLTAEVSITGWAPASEVKRHLINSRIMVLPSFAEGLPIVIMEALALGRPVISTHIAGIPELLRDGINGWLIPAGNAHALTKAMEAALTADTADLMTMAAIGRNMVAARHNIDTGAALLHGRFLGTDHRRDDSAAAENVATD
jgi:colanic acid/amylovoran biosynthesis glycosyltransferase